MVLAGVLNLCQTDSGRRVGAGLGGGGDSPNLSLFCSVVNFSPTCLGASGAGGTQDLGGKGRLTQPFTFLLHTSYLSFFVRHHSFWPVNYTPEKWVNL